MSTDLIGLLGVKGSGKDTAAAMLEGFDPVAVAAPLRDIVQRMFDLSDAYTAGDRKEEAGPLGVPYRRGMQAVGGLVRDQLAELLPEATAPPGGFWVAHLERALEKNMAEGKKTVVTDVRFVNEAEAILRRGGKLVHIARPKHLLDAYYAANGWKGDDADPSETGVREICERFAMKVTTVVNGGTLDNLRVMMKLVAK